MNPPIRKLPKSVTSLICASNQINGYLKAVQELVFNSLDANATAIAVRIHIPEGSIQVIDNGTGISQNDLQSTGDNYMTSKVVDISTLKSTPDKYGYQGQSLANLIQISGILKVASRFHTSETTWAKLFKNGKARYTIKCNQRPSKGTTVEIKGFLYNLRIRKKSVDVINDLQSIKVFLEYVSLVHSSISISLRDDSKNEIVYQIHKNRDIFQTISTLYGINKSNIQELQVEKKQYKLKAYIGKHEAENLRQLIFINGRAVTDSSRIQIKVNCALKKHFGGGNKKIKKPFHFQRVNNDEEEQLFTSCYPFYLIFITCPYIDYEFNTTVLEFKDWEQINKLLEKLIQFYAGAIQLKEPNKNYTKEPPGKEGTESTRNKVKKIMEKILGSHCRKPEISNMQNGIKGKMIKRNIKPKKTTLKLSKVIDVKKKLDNKMHTKQDFINTDLLNENQTIRKSGFKLPPRRGKTKSSKTINRIKKSMNPKVTKEPDQKCIINKNEKPNSKSFSKKLNLNSLFAMETDSVKKICELQEEKVEKNVNKSKWKSEMYLDKNVLHTQCNFIKDNRNLSIHKKVQELVIHEYIPKYNVENHIDDNRNKKSFISTYDLLQTIINSQFSHLNQQEKPINNLNSSFYPCISGPKRNYMPSNKERCFKSSFQQKEHSYDFMQSVFESDYISPLYVPDRNYEHFEREQEGLSVLIPDQTFTAPFTYTDPFNVTSKNSEHFKTPLPEFTNNCHNINFIQQTDTTSEVVTFQSHHYYEHNVDKNSNNQQGCNNKPRNFITTNSRNNFLVRSKVIEKNLRKKRIGYSRAVRGNKYKLNINKTAKLSNNDNIEKSYTIEFTERNVYNSFKNHFYRNVTHYPTLNIDTNIGSMIPSINNIYSGSNHSILTNTWLMTKNNNIMQNPSIQNRKTSLHTSPNILSHDHNQISFNNETGNYHETYTIKNLHESNSQNVTNHHSESNVKNYVFVSHENNENQQILNPINVCETILRNELTTEKEKEFDKSFNYNLDYSNTCKDIVTKSREVEELEKEFNFTNNNIDLCILSDKNASNNLAPSQTTPDKNDFEEISHHFTISENIIPELRNDGLRILNNKNVTNGNNKDVIAIVDSTDINEENYMGAFNMKNRLFFVPKGMSPIFKGQTKSNCQYDFNEEYYEDKIYNDFMCKLQNDVEIFKPRIDEANEVTTNDITKVNSKLNKTKASLKFDVQSIKTVKVLGQVDKKFIAAIMKGKTDIEEFLVLFDQHAVHERIRLENNLADYLSESQWKSVTIDEFSLKMSRDEILYLHNYKEKFAQFGLQWTILSYEEISINAIPEGILGKNPRQVDKIIKAVKNLIKEEIYNLQMQRGCVSLYPKCIMDLVFSEACRYAIKFGEHLTKSRCVELLNDLSDCKTPFQCAHGRPAMAVIMNIERNETKYKVDINKIPHLKTKM